MAVSGAPLLFNPQPQRRGAPVASTSRSFYGSVFGSHLKDSDLELVLPQESDGSKHRGSAVAFAVQTWQSGVSAVTWLLFTAVMLSVLCRMTHGQWPNALMALGFRSNGIDSASSAPASQQRHYCEDSDPLWCAQVLQVAANKSRRGLHTLHACRAAGGEAAVTNCMRSCGVCAILLSDCRDVQIVPGSTGSCNEHEDVVGEVCANDGNLDKEGYCTWMTTAKVAGGEVPKFVCGRCADAVISPERRAMIAQMAELRLEEDARETERLQHVDGAEPALEANRKSVLERNDLVVKR